MQPITGRLRTTPLDVLAEILLGWKQLLANGILLGLFWSISLQTHDYPPFDRAVGQREWGVVMELIALGALQPAALTFIVLVASGWFWRCLVVYCRRNVRRGTTYVLSAKSISARDANGLYTDIAWDDFRIIRPTRRLLVLRMRSRSKRLVITWNSFAPQDVPRAKALVQMVCMHKAAPVAACPPAGTTALPARLDAQGDEVTVPLSFTRGERFSIFLKLVPYAAFMTLGLMLMLHLVLMFSLTDRRTILFGATDMIDRVRLLLGLDPQTLCINAGSVVLSIVFLFVNYLRQIKAQPMARVRIDAQGIRLLDMDQDTVRVFTPWTVVRIISTPRFLEVKQGKLMSFCYPWRLFSPQDRARILAWAAQARGMAQP
ncbi:hypothetical protein ACU81Q_12130 [Komagataeibacter melomenusus]